MEKGISRPEKKITPSPAKKRKRDIDFGLLNPEERARITKEAQAQVLEEDRQAAVEAFLEEEKKRIERELHPEIVEPTETIQIVLPEWADAIRLDGRVLVHGMIVDVTAPVASVIREIMYRAQEHDDETSGKSERKRAWRRGLSSHAHRDTRISFANNPASF